MRGIQRRLLKLETRQGERFSAWIRLSSDEELDERLRKLVAVWKGCKPEEVDLSPENTIALAEELKAELSQSRIGYAKD